MGVTFQTHSLFFWLTGVVTTVSLGVFFISSLRGLCLSAHSDSFYFVGCTSTLHCTWVFWVQIKEKCDNYEHRSGLNAAQTQTCAHTHTNHVLSPSSPPPPAGGPGVATADHLGCRWRGMGAVDHVCSPALMVAGQLEQILVDVAQ